MIVEIVYALANEQAVMTVTVDEGATVEQAVNQSGILGCYPALQLNELQLGIFSQKVDLKTRVQAGDRIEIYRPLIIDPKQARRLRATNRIK